MEDFENYIPGMPWYYWLMVVQLHFIGAVLIYGFSLHWTLYLVLPFAQIIISVMEIIRDAPVRPTVIH